MTGLTVPRRGDIVDEGLVNSLDEGTVDNKGILDDEGPTVHDSPPPAKRKRTTGTRSKRWLVGEIALAAVQEIALAAVQLQALSLQ